MKVLRLITRGIRDAIKSVFRNFSLSIASIFSVVVTLLLVSVSIIMSSNVNYFTKQIENELTIVVFINKDTTSDGILTIKDEISTLSNVANIKYKSNEEIKRDMQSGSEVYNSIMSEWKDGYNPLKNTYLVKVTDKSKIGVTAKSLEAIQGVSSVQYGEGMAENLVSLFSIIEKITIGTVIALILVSAFLISNTIKITIFSRKTEIDIMRLVGTSNFVIKFPHIVEGFVIGVLGSIIPIIATIYGYVYLYTSNDGVFISNTFKLISPYNFVYIIAAALFAIGALVGMFGSYKAVRKHLTI